MANQIKAPINYPIIAGGKIVSGGSVIFGQPNVKPDPDNPSTLKAVYLDAALTQQAENPQGISSDGVFDQSDTGILYGPNDTVYSIVILGANKKQLSYIPEYDLSDANAAAAAQDSAAQAESAASNAIAAKDLTEALYTDFTNRYFGSYSSDPSVDDLGNPPNEGSIYFNTISNVFLTWHSGAWNNDFPSNPNGLMVTATGTTAPRTLADRAANVVNVKDFGAVGDGVTDDTLSIHAAIDAAAALAPIKLYAPAGSYIVDSITDRPDPLTIPSGVTFVGDGRDATEFKFKGGETHTGTLLHLTNVSDVEVSGMTINGNNVGSHAIRMATCTNIKLTDIVSISSNGYGLGMQQGYIRNVWLRSLWIINSYGDGIDIKDKDFSNSNINLEDITVSNFNVGLQSNKAALDLRSPCRVSGVYIEDFGQAGVTMDGLRLRPGEEPEANGRGAHTSQVDNVRVIPNKGFKVANTRGVVIEGRDCQLSNIYVQGCQQGILNYQSGSCVSGFNIANCNEGLFCVGATGYPSDGDRSSFSTGSISSCSSRAVVVESDYCNFSSVTLRSNEGGYQIDATANNTRIIGGSITNTGSGSSLVNNGSNTRVVACAGLSDI